jgi:hypothetical protein
MATCPRCTKPSRQREGAYFVCADCCWQWTVSITGRVYVQGYWSPEDRPRPLGHRPAAERLLRSVEGLRERLAGDWPAAPEHARWPALSRRELERVRLARAAAEAGYFNEGVPLAQLRQRGIPLVVPDDDP